MRTHLPVVPLLFLVTVPAAIIHSVAIFLREPLICSGSCSHLFSSFSATGERKSPDCHLAIVPSFTQMNRNDELAATKLTLSCINTKILCTEQTE